jgi:hypothetical protein
MYRQGTVVVTGSSAAEMGKPATFVMKVAGLLKN